MQAALLISVLPVFILLVRTPLVRPVTADPGAKSSPVRRSLPIPSYRTHRREGVNEESVLEVVPKNPQENPSAGHGGDGLEGQEHAPAQFALKVEESHAAHDEVRDEGERDRHDPSQVEPPVGVVESQPVQPDHRSSEQVSVLRVVVT